MNAYRNAVIAYKRQWLNDKYELLLRTGYVSEIVQKHIESEGGVDRMPVDRLDSFGDLVCRTLEKAGQA